MDDNQDNGGYTFTLDFCNGVSTCSSDNGTAAVSTYLRKSILNNGMGWWAILMYAYRRCRFVIPDTAGLPLVFKKESVIIFLGLSIHKRWLEKF